MKDSSRSGEPALGAADAAWAVASSHQAAQAAKRKIRLASIAAAWDSIDSGAGIARQWTSGVANRIWLLIRGGQEDAASESEAFVARALAAQGVLIDSPGLSPASFAGVANDGRSLDSLIALAPLRTVEGIARGESSAEALAAGKRRLLMLAEQQMIDAGRSADSTVIAAGRARKIVANRAQIEKIREALSTTTLSPEREADIARRLRKRNVDAVDPVAQALKEIRNLPETPTPGDTLKTTGVNVGYVRMLTPPSCDRCVILAGKWYRWNQGFKRHPNCDCRHIPATEAIAGDITVDPMEYFNSLSIADQNKYFGKANAEAIREEGADIFQIVNARMTYGSVFTADDGRRYTREGITSRSLAAKQRRRLGLPKLSARIDEFGRIPVGRPVLRPTVWQIYRDAKGSRTAARQALIEFGYIRV